MKAVKMRSEILEDVGSLYRIETEFGGMMFPMDVNATYPGTWSACS